MQLRNSVEEIKKIFKNNKLNIINSKNSCYKRWSVWILQSSQSKPFYNDLCAYLSSGPIVVMILEGENAIAANRKLMGATDPKNADEKLLGNCTVLNRQNSVHGSDFK